MRPAARSKSSLSGIFDKLLRRDGDGFARGAPAGIAHDAVARSKFGHAGADALDDAGELGRRRERKRRLVLVFAGDDQRVEEIKRRGLDPHHGLAGTGVRLGDVGQFEFVGRAEMGAEDGFHGGRSFQGRSAGAQAPNHNTEQRAYWKLPAGLPRLRAACSAYFVPLFRRIGLNSKDLL